MAKHRENNIKLGVFVITGLVVMMISFYMIGSNTSMFGGKFILKSRFNNLNGLMEGNNVLFSGIQAGTVKSITIVNDTTIEVSMIINSKIKDFIHNNAEAGVGTEGLMGNKVVNILPIKGNSPLVKSGDLLGTQKLTSIDEMLQTLTKTNNNVAIISEVLKATVIRLDTSAIIQLLNDKEIGTSLKSSLKELNFASNNTSEMTYALNQIVKQIKQGKGGAGVLLTDTNFESHLKIAVFKLKSASDNANKMTIQLNDIATNINHDLNYGKGPLNALLRDSMITSRLNTSTENIQNGTQGLSEIVEALKHNFLVRGYFRKQQNLKKNN